MLSLTSGELRSGLGAGAVAAHGAWLQRGPKGVSALRQRPHSYEGPKKASS